MSNTRNYYHSEYSVQGSNALKSAGRAGQRRLETVPDRNRRGKYERDRREETVIRTMPAPAWDLQSLFVIIAAVAVAFGMCISYLQVQESITAMSKRIAVLESEIMTLKNENDAEYNRIDSSVDLSYVYEVAVNELGMVHATDNQVIPYNSRKSNSVRQYGEIPQETESVSGLFGGN